MIHSIHWLVDPQSINVDLNLQSPGLNVTMEEIKVLLDNYVYDSQHKPYLLNSYKFVWAKE